MTALLYDGHLEKPLDRALEVGARQLAIRGDLVTPWLSPPREKKISQVRLLDRKPLRPHAPPDVRRHRRHHERLPRPPRRLRKKPNVNPISAKNHSFRAKAHNPRYNLPKSPIAICSARTSPRNSTASIAVRILSTSQPSRKLFTSVFLFFAKQNFTNSRNASFSPLNSSEAHSPATAASPMSTPLPAED